MITLRPLRQIRCHIRLINACMALILLSLTSCVSVPQPFAGAERNDAIITSITINPAVTISPIRNIPEPLQSQIAEWVAEKTRDKDVAATTQNLSESSSRLTGFAIGTTNSSGQKQIEIAWTLTASNGLGTDTITTKTPIVNPNPKDPQQGLTQSDFAPAIEEVANFLELALFRPSAIRTRPETPPQVIAIEAPYQISIGTITGSPGDGDRALTAAMQAIFRDPRLSVPINLTKQPKESQSGNAYIVTADVALKQKGMPQEIISIDWHLLSVDGDVLGSVEQNNEIEQGSLNGEWGEIAYFAAEAAAEGILNILIEFKP